MLAREITAELQLIRNCIQPGQKRALVSKGISFGQLSRNRDGSWDVSQVAGLPAESLLSTPPIDPLSPPSLIIRPWHQAGAVISLREFTNNAFNQHHGMQPVERFGRDNDPDGDGVANELTQADITAVTLFQAVMAVPGHVIPSNPEIVRAVTAGERLFRQIGCVDCHVPTLPLGKRSWVYTEPNPYNPPGNLRVRTGTGTVGISLLDSRLPQPRLKPLTRDADVIDVPLYTDFRLHDICEPGDPNREALDQNQPAWSPKFRVGNRRFLTARLWGAANQPPFFHHGRFTTLRESVLAHHGEAEYTRDTFLSSSEYQRNSLIEFLKTLQVLPPGTRNTVVDEKFRGRKQH